MAARVFEKQADIELRREEWREEVVKTKKRALEVTETWMLFCMKQTYQQTYLLADYRRQSTKGGGSLKRES